MYIYVYTRIYIYVYRIEGVWALRFRDCGVGFTWGKAGVL